jgi:sterol desaturase/sphingolipid hydroxylase (fatty acid hydroxylase superfamily)
MTTDVTALRTGFSLGVLAFLLAWETAAPFFPYFRQNCGTRVKHGFRNLSLSVINTFMIAVGFSVAWKAAASWAEKNGFGLLHGIEGSGGWHALLAVLILDFWTYWWHWLNHRVPFFWRFHRTHHSDSRMDVTTANRFHTGEIFFSSLIRIGLIPLIGIHLWELAVYEILFFAVVQFHHANVSLPAAVDRVLRLLFPTPAMHKVHHSRLISETNSNYSSLFSIWDRLFGTLRTRSDLSEIQFGLAGYDAPELQSLKGLLRTPFRKENQPEQFR